jgi:mercuric reductase
MPEYDLLILGSGSTAFAAAIRAAESGFTALMTERRSLGGTCVSRGCIPSKTLIAAAELWHAAGARRFAGVSIAPRALDFPALVREKDELVGALVRDKYESVLRDSIHVLDGDATLAGCNAIRVDGRRVTGRHVLIATGSRPSTPDIAGLDAVPYLTSDLLTVGEAEELTELPASIAIVGGGYIACELGQMFARFGARVSIIERGARLLGHGESEISDALREVLEREGIEVRTESAATAVEQRGRQTVVSTASGDEIAVKRLLMATGRTPNSDHLGLEDAGVTVDARGFVSVDGQLRTNVPAIWAAGDVRGGEMATPVGAHDGAIAADNALNDAQRLTDYRVVPRAVFTDPPVGSVGITEAEARESGLDVQSVTIPMDVIPRAVAVHRKDGALKMLTDAASRRVLGVHMLGESAHEVIHEAAIAMRFGATLDDFVDLVHVYPTMSEALKIAALAFTRDVRKMSCCAE